MGLASALSTALTGLSASETTIDVVGNNLANANTVGFKASEANFANQFLQTQSLGSGPTTTSGGSNPRQIGLGAMVADISPNFSQGTIEVSTNSTDMAIQGDGFFIVEGNNTAYAYTRNGIFKLNAASELTTTTGNRLLGYGIDNQFNIETTALVPITIPIGSLIVAKATENVTMQGQLKPNGTVADAAKIIQSNILGNATYKYPDTLPTTEVSGRPNISSVTFTPDYVTPGGHVGVGTYYYKLVFSDGTPDDPPTLEGTASAASIARSVTSANATVDITGFDALPSGNYDHVNIYRTNGTDGPDGVYYYLNTANASDPVFHDTYAVGTTELDETLLANNQYNYYIAFGKAGSDPSRPSAKIGPISPVSGRIHISDLPSAGANPDGWDSWIIYRDAPSTAGTNRYFELTQIPFSSTTASYTDSTADIDLYTSETVHEPEIDLDGPKIQEGTLLTAVRQRTGSSYEQVFSDTGTLSFVGRKGGSDLTAQTFTLTPTATVGDFLQFMEESLGIQESTATNGIPPSIDVADPTATPISPGYDVVDGRMQLTGNNGEGNAIDIKSLTGTFTSLPFSIYQDAVGESATSNLTVYDSLGIACNVRLTAVLQSSDHTATTYRWFADSPDNQLSTGEPIIAVGTGLLKFDGHGNLISATQTKVLINRENLPSDSPLQFDLNFSNVSALDTTTSSLSPKDQDGSAPGVLSSFIAGEDGLIRGVFSNGVTRDLGQIRLARFSNPAGLEQMGENMYTTGVNSGLPVEGNPGQQGIGSLVAGATELSNADVGSNLIELIMASTMYRSNTRTISTIQTMLDTLLQLQR